MDFEIGEGMLRQLDRIALFLTDEPPELQAAGFRDFCCSSAKAFRSRGLDARSARRTAGLLGARLLSRISHFEAIKGNA